MRKRFDPQLSLGATPIEKLTPPKGRDAQTAVLHALQWVFTTPKVNEEVFALLEEQLSPKQQSLGRKGMDLWTILVFGVMRLTRNQTYDSLWYSANHDGFMRQLIGIGLCDQDRKFSLTSVKENVELLNTEVLAQINAIIIKHGGREVEKKTKKRTSKQTATSLKQMSISRLISILP